MCEVSWRSQMHIWNNQHSCGVWLFSFGDDISRGETQPVFRNLMRKRRFLNSPLTYEVWVKFPVWCVQPLRQPFAKLRKVLCGLRQLTAKSCELQHRKVMAFDPTLHRSKVYPCFCFRVKDGQCLCTLVHVDDCIVAYWDRRYFEEWLSYFRCTLDADDYLDVKLIGDATNLMWIYTNIHTCN